MSRSKDDHPRVTVALITYIPVLAGYYAESLDVLKVCLESIWANTDVPYELLVFDNASCPAVRTYLQRMQQEGRIQYLVLSEKNLGKSGAWNFVLMAAPGEIISYADSDVYFYPGWLSAQLSVLARFPETGMVTGMPVSTPLWSTADYSTATVSWAERQPNVKMLRGKVLAWEDYWRHARSLGAEEATARQQYQATEDLCLEVAGQRYFVGAAHFQFTGPKAAFESVLPLSYDRPMGQVSQLDTRLNEHGYLRLSTPEWWIQHLGNTLSGTDFSSQAHMQDQKASDRGQAGVWKHKWVRAFVSWVYHRSFDILYGG
ncbi:MAG: glycosyltransferase family 2 protein [Anaerolineales bacterium]|nr:glycosyltransferase family 2 protein [Anaerolineales bacterium]